jgi:hypothetical protein
MMSSGECWREGNVHILYLLVKPYNERLRIDVRVYERNTTINMSKDRLFGIERGRDSERIQKSK